MAALIGRSAGAVARKRRQLGIRRGRATGPSRPWGAGERAAVRRPLTVRELAARLCRSESAVPHQRWELGIPGVRGPPANAWTKTEAALLRSGLTAREVAKQIGRTVKAVQSRRENLRIRKAGRHFWTPLGTMPDPTLAGQLGVTVVAVKTRRKVHGVPAYVDPRSQFTAAQLALLDQLPDEELAARWGVTRYAVWKKRLDLGILRGGHHDWTAKEWRCSAAIPTRRSPGGLASRRAA